MRQGLCRPEQLMKDLELTKFIKILKLNIFKFLEWLYLPLKLPFHFTPFPLFIAQKVITILNISQIIASLPPKTLQ